MKAALLPLLGAAATACACYSSGAMFIDRLGIAQKLRRSERIPLAFILGAGCLHLILFAILSLHLGHRGVLNALLAVLILAGLALGAFRNNGAEEKPLSLPLKSLFGALSAVYFFVYLFNAWAPEDSADGSGYHLGLVAQYLRVHGFEKITTDFYAAFGAGVDLLYVPAFALGGHSAAALLHFCFGMALALAMLAYGRRIGKPWVGAAGALLTSLSPVVGMDQTSAYNDVAAAAIVFAAFYWSQIWDESRDSRLLVPLGLVAGYAFAAKYTAFPIALFALGFVAFRTRKWKPVLAVAGLCLVMSAPWVARNWIWYDNPLAPFGNRLFRNPYVHVILEQNYTTYLRTYNMRNLWALPYEVTVRGQATEGLVGPIFLFTPLALFALRYREGRILLAAGALVFSTYFANVGTRFLIPTLPFVSLALAMACGETTPLLAALMIFQAVAAYPSVLKQYTGRFVWKLEHIPVEAALRIIPQDTYLTERDPGYLAARMMDRYLPPGERVLAFDFSREAYTAHQVLVSYRSASNEVLADIVTAGFSPASQPTRAREFHFTERKVRRLRVVQTEQAERPEQWNIHELRFLNHGVELPRNAAWRLRAWPNPWDVQLAFDNSPVTRWRSWEVAFPGMYIDVDFGREESLDEVRLETSSDIIRVRMQLEAMNPTGQWEKIAGEPNDVAIPPGSFAARRMATRELEARGLHYLLVVDTDFGFDDFRDDPDVWGLKLVASTPQARLYKVLP
jgi:hypothetical protein